jgi:hypothetical protein
MLKSCGIGQKNPAKAAEGEGGVSFFESIGWFPA